MIVREGIQIGKLFLHFYGLIIIIGAILAAVLAASEAKRRKLSPDFIWDMLPWALIGGIIGARFWHILTPSPSQGITAVYYFTHPLDALAIWKGGLGIPGAVIGGALAVYIYTRKKGLNFLQWADMTAPRVYYWRRLLAGGGILLTRKSMDCQPIYHGQFILNLPADLRNMLMLLITIHYSCTSLCGIF